MTYIPLRTAFFVNAIRFHRILLIVLTQVLIPSVYAEWEAETSLSSYYTDNVGLFAVSRRLSLEDDPTQPVIDDPEQSSDFVYEPRAGFAWNGKNSLGAYTIGFVAGAYIFQDKHKYTHSFYEARLIQDISDKTQIKFFYDFIPDAFLGKKRAYHEDIEEFEADELLDSHIWALHFDHHITPSLIARALTRFGIRRYDQRFAYRDTHFFTVGPHLEWIITPDIELLIGYHFERGYAEGKQAEFFNDDISYMNHYTSAELKIKLREQLILMLIFDYEHNDLLSKFAKDFHHEGNENVFQAETELMYEFTKATTVKLGWQHGTRRYSYEDFSVRNNNVWLGLEYRF